MKEYRKLAFYIKFIFFSFAGEKFGEMVKNFAEKSFVFGRKKDGKKQVYNRSCRKRQTIF